MAALDLTEFSNDLDEIINDLPTQFTISGSTYTGLVAPVDEMFEAVTGYDSNITVEFVIVCNKNQFTTIPPQRSSVVVDGKTYKLSHVQKHPSLPTLNLYIGTIK